MIHIKNNTKIILEPGTYDFSTVDMDRITNPAIVENYGELEIESVRFFKQFVILKFKGIDSLNDVEIYRKKNLYVTRENAVKLKKDEYFIADLIGLTVFEDDGSLIGELKDVLTTGANDVYVIEGSKYGEVLVPAIKDCVLKVDMEERKMEVHLLPGLVD